jgi:hypothetical protein
VADTPDPPPATKAPPRRLGEHGADPSRKPQRIFAGLAFLLALAVTLVFTLPAIGDAWLAWRIGSWERATGTVVSAKLFGVSDARTLFARTISLDVEFTYTTAGERRTARAELDHYRDASEAKAAQASYREGATIDVLIEPGERGRAVPLEASLRGWGPLRSVLVGLACAAGLVGVGRWLWRHA